MVVDSQREAAASAAEEALRARQLFTRLFTVASVLEGLLLVVVLLTADFTDPTHRLILACSLFVYGTLSLGLFALGAYVRWQAARLLARLDERAD